MARGCKIDGYVQNAKCKKEAEVSSAPIQYINAQFISLGAPYTVPFDLDEIDKKKASISPYWRRTMTDEEWRIIKSTWLADQEGDI